jgi:hypothetical protein
MPIKPTDKLLSSINTAIEQNARHNFRNHLGASIIGHDCARYIWYTFRWAKKIKHDARKLRIFERGLITEPRVSVWLKQSGATLWTHNKNNEQFKVSTLDGHFGGSLDGILKDVSELGPKLHVLEIKTHGDQNFKQLLKHGVEKAFLQHYIQATLYAYLMRIDYVLYFALNANTEKIYLERFKIKKSVAKEYIKRAKQIIYSDSAPSRISKTKTFFKCKMCDYRDICWEVALVEINCRTCAFCKPASNKKWSCNYTDTLMLDTRPKMKCHIYHEDLLPYKTKIKCVDTKNISMEIVLPNQKESILYGPEHTDSTKLYEIIKTIRG